MLNNRTESGGQKLRRLRKAARLSQMAVELDAELGDGYLHRVESGKIKGPLKETLERILKALGARYDDCRDVLEAFGYHIEASLPTEAEIGWVLQECGPVIESAAMPAYLLDCAVRVLVYNRYLCALLGASPESKEMTTLLHGPLFEQVFDSQSWLYSRLSHHDKLLPILMMTLQADLAPYLDERWCQEIVELAMVRLPLFKKYWEAVKQAGPYDMVDRPLLPVHFHSPIFGEITCRVAMEFLRRDSRFRAVYLIPSDQASIDRFDQWARDAENADAKES